jgi:hypothetical protein
MILGPDNFFFDELRPELGRHHATVREVCIGALTIAMSGYDRKFAGFSHAALHTPM